jgi:signal transduction histidine kinase
MAGSEEHGTTHLQYRDVSGQRGLAQCSSCHDATPDKGRITLATTRVSITKEELAHQPDARVGPFVCISVSDNGCGISAKDLPHIFGPFFTTKGNTGLGLWSCRETVRKGDGWIEVRTEVGHGSTFSIFLPEVDPPK